MKNGVSFRGGNPRQGDQVSATPLWLRHQRGPLINDLIDRREAAKTFRAALMA
jgi:hypothetical protein